MTSDAYYIGPVRFAYNGNSPCIDLSELEIARGSVTVIAGENGSGKTTLLKILGGILHPMAETSEESDLRQIQRDAVYLHQNPYLFRGTVARNLKLASPSGSADLGGNDVMSALGLAGFSEQRVRTLSGGEAKRVALARVFLSDRPILLLDEPAAHVDSASMRLIERACRRFASEARTVVIASHRDSFGYRVADRIIDLVDGRTEPRATNVMKGETLRVEESHILFRCADTTFRAPLRDGAFSVAVVHGEDILLSRRPLESSARNSLSGKLTALDRSGSGAVIARIDCGISLMSVITESAIAELELKPGTSVYATFKASSVALY